MKYIILIIALQGCSVTKTSAFNGFESQRQLMLYCENSEGSIKKKAGLKLIELGFKLYQINLRLYRGLCEQYYQRREPANGYIYLNNHRE